VIGVAEGLAVMVAGVAVLLAEVFFLVLTEWLPCAVVRIVC